MTIKDLSRFIWERRRPASVILVIALGALLAEFFWTLLKHRSPEVLDHVQQQIQQNDEVGLPTPEKTHSRPQNQEPQSGAEKQKVKGREGAQQERERRRQQEELAREQARVEAQQEREQREKKAQDEVWRVAHIEHESTMRIQRYPNIEAPDSIVAEKDFAVQVSLTVAQVTEGTRIVSGDQQDGRVVVEIPPAEDEWKIEVDLTAPVSTFVPESQIHWSSRCRARVIPQSRSFICAPGRLVTRASH
jgi:hypothetical protein